MSCTLKKVKVLNAPDDGHAPRKLPHEGFYRLNNAPEDVINQNTRFAYQGRSIRGGQRRSSLRKLTKV